MLRCSEVARLIASEELSAAGRWIRFGVCLHLSMCWHCRRYAAQLRVATRALACFSGLRSEPRTPGSSPGSNGPFSTPHRVAVHRRARATAKLTLTQKNYEPRAPAPGVPGRVPGLHGEPPVTTRKREEIIAAQQASEPVTLLGESVVRTRVRRTWPFESKARNSSFRNRPVQPLRHLSARS